MFGPPWTVDNPVFPVTVREGQGRGSYVITLVASDPTEGDGIDRYILNNNPGNNFEINNATGSILVLLPIKNHSE